MVISLDIRELVLKPVSDPAGVPGRPRGGLLYLQLGLLGYQLALRPPFNLPLLEAQHKGRGSLPGRRFCGSGLVRFCGSALVFSPGMLLPLKDLFQARSRTNPPRHGIGDRLGVGTCQRCGSGDLQLICQHLPVLCQQAWDGGEGIAGVWISL